MKTQEKRMDGMSPNEFKALTEAHRSEQFLKACRTPGRWLDRAYLHKRAADIIYDVAYSAFKRYRERVYEARKKKMLTTCISKTYEGEELQDFHDRRLLAEYLLLAGYALECIFKGYLLSSRTELVIEKKRIGEFVKTHDLVKLCHECSIELSDDERSILKLMTRHILWGKYTAPLFRDHMPSWIDPEDQEEKSLAISNPFHNRRVQVVVNNIYARGWSLLEKEQGQQVAE